MYEAEKDAAEKITSAINIVFFSEEAFCEEMTKQHRTLQQSFTSLCFAWIRKCSNLEPWEIDGRNEAAVEACKKNIASMNEEDVRRLPFI